MQSNQQATAAFITAQQKGTPAEAEAFFIRSKAMRPNESRTWVSPRLYELCLIHQICPECLKPLADSEQWKLQDELGLSNQFHPVCQAVLVQDAQS